MDAGSLSTTLMGQAGVTDHLSTPGSRWKSRVGRRLRFGDHGFTVSAKRRGWRAIPLRAVMQAFHRFQPADVRRLFPPMADGTSPEPGVCASRR